MKELLEYRKNLLKRLSAAAQEFRAACEAAQDIRKPIEDGWNVHQLAAHTRDVDKLVYGMRVRRTATEQNPLFGNFDAEAHHAEHYDPNEPLDKILYEFTSSVNDLAGWLKTLPDDAWSRESRHETQGGGLTLQTWVERALAHIEEHLHSVKKAS
jgi:hypothetical protein